MSQVKEPGLIPGMATSQHFDVLLSFTGIRGEVLKAALRAHFVDGLSQRDAIQQTGVNQDLLSRKAAALQAINDRLKDASKYYPSGK
ncbi:Na(+)-translocating NADH-quinone reductase subunit C (plasmid) [Pseudomonas antarctica]|uniref:Na(+)-translocating NADH-quinone reductase subunit C n=1 Tax=Pseudomonas antarctica TaxID=219572 RepID=A0A172Z9U7_9PSED|nr:PapB/FocB family fimbrial expression transcriptional regulator [Pseudomonas antarctica]ANF89287.1 Na(+)-translocating NADH-quinone reductase subunit C [Pseudomonas antarctica]